MWSALAAYEHIWNPKWRTSIVRRLRQRRLQRHRDQPDPAAQLPVRRWRTAASPWSAGAEITAFTPLPGNSCSPDYSFWEAGTRTQWNPVPQLDIGLEVLYSQRNTAFKGAAIVGGERLAARRSSAGHRRPERHGPRCSAGSATSIHDRLSDPGKLQTPAANRRGFCIRKHGP